MEDLIKELEKVSLCFTINVDDHKGLYETAKQIIEHKDFMIHHGLQEEDMDELKDILPKCKELNKFIDIHVYSITPVGFYKIIHYDLTKALKEAIKLCKQDRGLK